MPLTEKDLPQVKGLVHGEVGNLARVVAKDFEQVNKQAEIKKHFVYRDEFEDLMARVAYLEKRAGIKSGK